jgi:hypothetical protein
MEIDEHTDQPTAVIELAGKSYRFSEILLEDWGHLQSWIRQEVPHPVQAIKPYLSDLPPEERKALLDEAMRKAEHWPPKLGTGDAIPVLIGNILGQIETLWVALKRHQPGTTRRDAQRIYHATLRAGQRERLDQIWAVAFGMDGLDAAEASHHPKAEGKTEGPISPSIGT